MNHKPPQSAGGHRQSSSAAPGPPSTGELYVQDKENARVCHRLRRPRFTSSFSLRPSSSPPPLSLSSKSTTPPCQQPALVTCPTTSSTPILSISLLFLQGATILNGLCLALVTLPPFRNWRAGTTRVPFAAGLARNLPLGVVAGAAEFVCEFDFIRDTARAQKCVPNTLLGIIGRCLGQTEALCLWLCC